MFGILTIALLITAPVRPATMLQPQFKNFIIVQRGEWTAPAGVTQVYVECTGQGGIVFSGGAPTGGAGGGAYSASLVTVVPGAKYQIGPNGNLQNPPANPKIPVPNVKGIGQAFTIAAIPTVLLVYAEGGEFVDQAYGTTAQGKGGKAIFGVGAIRFDGGDGGLTDQTTFAKAGWFACGGGGDPGTANGPGANGPSTTVKGVRAGNGGYFEASFPAPVIVLQPIAPVAGQGGGGDYPQSGLKLLLGGVGFTRISW